MRCWTLASSGIAAWFEAASPAAGDGRRLPRCMHRQSGVAPSARRAQRPRTRLAAVHAASGPDSDALSHVPRPQRLRVRASFGCCPRVSTPRSAMIERSNRFPDGTQKTPEEKTHNERASSRPSRPARSVGRGARQALAAARHALPRDAHRRVDRARGPRARAHAHRRVVQAFPGDAADRRHRLLLRPARGHPVHLGAARRVLGLHHDDPGLEPTSVYRAGHDPAAGRLARRPARRHHCGGACRTDARHRRAADRRGPGRPFRRRDGGRRRSQRRGRLRLHRLQNPHRRVRAIRGVRPPFHRSTSRADRAAVVRDRGVPHAGVARLSDRARIGAPHGDNRGVPGEADRTDRGRRRSGRSVAAGI